MNNTMSHDGCTRGTTNVSIYKKQVIKHNSIKASQKRTMGLPESTTHGFSLKKGFLVKVKYFGYHKSKEQYIGFKQRTPK